MSKVEIQVIYRGLQELMKSPEIQGVLDEQAKKVVSRCKKGSYETDIYVGKTRANASVATRDWATYYRNLKDNELLKALNT